jgi:hypothetical protein
VSHIEYLVSEEEQMGSSGNQPQGIYEIRVRGELDRNWQLWFDGLAVALTAAGGQPPTTTLTGPVADQAALRGILCRLWDLNLTLLSVRRVEADAGEECDDV